MCMRFMYFIFFLLSASSFAMMDGKDDELDYQIRNKVVPPLKWWQDNRIDTIQPGQWNQILSHDHKTLMNLILASDVNTLETLKYIKRPTAVKLIDSGLREKLLALQEEETERQRQEALKKKAEEEEAERQRQEALKKKAEEEEAERQRIAVQQQHEAGEQRQARVQQARQWLASGTQEDLARFYNGFAIPIMRDLVQQGRLHEYYITTTAWLSYEALRVAFPGADFSDPVVFFRTTANRHTVAVALEEALR